jgi:integrase
MHLDELILDWYASGAFEDLAPSERRVRGPRLEWWSRHGLTVEDLTPPRVDALGDEAGVSGATWNRYLSALSAVLTWAVRRGTLEANPLRKVQRGRERGHRVRFLDDAERARLLEAVQADPFLLAWVQLALTTGGRQGEIAALHWRDVDFGRGTVTFLQTKNGRPRSLPLLEGARTAVAALRTLVPYDPDLPVLPDRFPWRAWQAAVGAAALTDARFHDLRHTFGSYLAQAGLSLVEIMHAMGHRTLAAAQRYLHLTPGHVHAAVSRALSDRLRGGA